MTTHIAPANHAAPGTAGSPVDPQTPIVELRGITKRYGSVEALAGIDLDVMPGEIVAVLGPNGAGKTTAIAIMLGLRQPSVGTVRVFGEDPLHAGVRERIGAMLQESGIPATLRVGEVVDLFRAYYPLALPRDEVLAAADLLDLRDRPAGKLSGGQRQRLYFALALAGDPDLLFLDEPTVGMDVAARRAFWDRIRALAELGKTVLFSTHLLEEADALATRIVLIDRGRVIAAGTPAEIKARVAGKRIRVRGPLSTDAIGAIPGITSVARHGGYHLLTAEDAMPVLRHLMALGSLVEEVTVEDAGLEAAFLGLTEEGADR
ncbi:MAG TPA: ABC transporter ATP-binding protein [Candidatus Limnocylindrales bacterium]|nr:ABC transporter ATP-binding protein [Candidatus Limnocylindrales bacterium]